MDWQFIRELLKGVFTFSGNIVQSILAYVGVVSFIYLLYPRLEGKMKDKLSTLRRHKLNILLFFLLASVLLTSYNLYENKSPTFATPSELTSPFLSGLNIRVTDLVSVYSEPIVSGKIFENNHFYGPAVLSIRANNKIEGLSIVTEAGVTADTAIIYTPNEEYIGVIILDGNIFKGINKLHNISIITNSQDIADTMREELRKSIEQLGK